MIVTTESTSATSPTFARRCAEIAWRAATIGERLDRIRREPGGEAEADPALLDGWARAFSRGDRPALARRLSWDGIELATAARALGAGPESDTEPLPPWLETARERFRLGTDWRLRDSGGVDLERLPFAELWAPWTGAAIAECLRRIDERTLAPILVRALGRGLAEDLAAAGARAAHERFARRRAVDPAAGSYARFVDAELAAGFLDFADDFPLALRQLTLLAEDWISGVVELAERLESDRARLGERFGGAAALGAAVSVERLRSDRHGGGRRLHRVRFAGGADLVLKPRALALEAAYEQLIARLGALGFVDLPPAARTLDLGTHGWQEWIAAEELRDEASIAAWYRRAGALVAVAELLGAEDLHAENVVATRRGPVVVDGEMLAQPDRPGIDPRQRFAGGLLRPRGGDDRVGRWAGLLPVEPRVLSERALSWRGIGGDAIDPVSTVAMAAPLPNAPRLGGRQLTATRHSGPLVAGYRRTWEALLATRDELLADDGALAGFAGAASRLLFRASHEYAVVLDRLTAPRCQRDGAAAGILLEAMLRPFAAAETAPRVWPLVAVERRALERLDVPRFEIAVDATAIEAEGVRVDGLTTRSGRAAIERRLRAMTEEEIDRRCAILEEALAPDRGPRIALDAPTGGSALARALALADRLARFEQERAAWLAAHPAPRHDAERRLRDLALYDGRLGRALVLAAADRRQGGGGRFAAARAGLYDALDRFADESEGAALSEGGLDGLGSLVWGLVALASAANDPEALGRAFRFADRLGARREGAAGGHDLLSGAAGAILALLAFAEAAGAAEARSRAVALGDRLLAARRDAPEGGRAWSESADERPLSGFAHGAAGIARALAALWEATGERRFAEAVADALAFERTRFDEAAGDWPVVRPSAAHGDPRRVAMNAYCHGGAGIALGRAMLAPGLRDARFARELDAAIATTLLAGLGDFDHLCCGGAGRIATLVTAGRLLGRRDGLAAAAGYEFLSTRALRLPRAVRGRPEAEAGLFRGLAGVAWLGLFLASGDDPALLDPLALELPSEARARAALARDGAEGERRARR